MLVLCRGAGLLRNALAIGRRSCDGVCAVYCLASSSTSTPMPRERASSRHENVHSAAAVEVGLEGEVEKRDETAEKEEGSERRRQYADRRVRAAIANARIERAKRRSAFLRMCHSLKSDEKPSENVDEHEGKQREENEVDVSRMAGDTPTESLRVVDSESEHSDDEALTERRKKELGECQFRKIIYDEGELDQSDLTLPPSKENPHPFDPSANPEWMPPTYSRSLVPYVNHFPALQNLVLLGVDLLDVDSKTQVGRKLVKMDWERELLPRLVWLVKLGVAPSELGSYLTRNPFFLIQDLNAMKVRVNYLRSKRFTKKEIVKIVVSHRYWLNTEVRVVDARLGWFQQSFSLSGNEVRSLLVKEPRIIMFGIGPVQRLVQMFSKELDFSKTEIKSMLLSDPRLFMMDAPNVLASYAYLHYTMGLTNGQLARYPLALRCSVAAIRRRHEFLVRIGRDHYEDESPDTVSLQSLLHPSDRFFAVNVARVFLIAYNEFLKRY